MTRKQALYKVLEVISDKELKEKINDILDDMPFTGWSEQTIFDSIDQFILDNGRIPTTTDFKKKGLPPHPVIKLRFGITLKEFLEKYYPNNKLCNSKIYYNKTKVEWQQVFIKEYNNIMPFSAEEYNKKRKRNTPSWATISNMFDIKKWIEWLNYCDLERHHSKIYKSRQNNNLSISSHNDLEEQLKQQQ